MVVSAVLVVQIVQFGVPLILLFFPTGPDARENLAGLLNVAERPCAGSCRPYDQQRRHAPKSDSEGAENGTMENRPLIETPPMARRGE